MKILLVRLSAIGDVLFATPLVAAVRRAYPTAEISWLVQPECAPLIEHHPDLDRVLIWPKGEWRTLWQTGRRRDLARAMLDLRRRLRACRFDLALDLQGLAKSGLLTWLSGAPERIGLGSREASGYLMTRTLPRAGDERRIGSEYRFLAEHLGLPTADFAMALYLTAADRAFAEIQITRHELAGGHVALCPFTTRPQKHWQESRWAELADRLAAELDLPAVLLGGPNDRPAADRIGHMTSGHLVDLVGATGLREAAALIERAALVIGVDTGLAHMGLALRRPSLLLFGATRPYLDPEQPDARILYRALDCSPCRRGPTCDGRFPCMRSIEVGDCLAAARDLLRRDAR
ncbi:glycosyltransferase family 9 protein [Thioalkalicoccus limnaeus]|uniref:Glycosyltransferase family 9 protein n=1 Tax=Thioalkalicoccus limnaeus TaxID=120681 RepID=A0ABV4BCS7_9GAMM